MSWSTSTQQACTPDELESNLGSQPDELGKNSDCPDEVREQVTAALAVARELAKAVGASKITAQLSGHANPGHANRPSYANDCISVSVQKVE